MATAADLRATALSLEGTLETPHFDRAAFRVSRIYATLAADGKTANLKFTADEQALQIEMHPAAFAPVNGAWGTQGWTTVTLSKVPVAVLKEALRLAWHHAQPAAKRSKRQRSKI